MIQRYFSTLRQEFSGYGSKAVSDLLAGITVAAVALPLALAFGVSSGADAGAGLITAIIAGLVMSLLAGGFYQISGPTGAMAAILTSLVAQYGMQGVFLATLLAGLILLAAGVLHLGKLTSFIPAPVITGFTSGIAVIIALGQVDNFFGVSSQGATAVEKLLSYGRLGFHPDLTALGLGLFVVVFMVVYPAKLNKLVPGSLVAIVLATAAAILLKLDAPAVGAIPQTLLPEQRLRLAEIDWGSLGALVTPAVSIAMLGMIESLLCGASAGKMTGVPMDSDQELIAQGVGNILLPFFGGIPATAAIARTSVAVKSGARTRMTGVFHAVGLLVSMFLLAPVMSRIPLAALAGVLMVTAWRMNDWSSIRYIFSHRFKGAMLKFLVTMLATILFDLTIAILLGVIVAMALMASRLSKLEVHCERADMSRLQGVSPALQARYANTMVAYVTGPILFANTDAVRRIASCLQGCDTLILSMRGVSHIDVSGAQALGELLDQLQLMHVDAAFCGLPEGAMDMLKRSDLYDRLGEGSFYWSTETVLRDLRPAPLPR